MLCPVGCPEQLYEMMRKCWRDSAASRPIFEMLQWSLEKLCERSQAKECIQNPSQQIYTDFKTLGEHDRVIIA